MSNAPSLKARSNGDDVSSKAPNIKTIAKLIKSGKAKKIILMAGAGISTAAGIPDFRTPGTGLYDNLAKYNLPRPEAIFEIGYFKPTLTHYFIKLLHQKNVLLRCFTQNIDTLEQLAGLPEDAVVEAHGSFANAQCLDCKKLADPKWMKETVFSGVIPKCLVCGGIVKPCITFFGENLPQKFFRHMEDFDSCDLLIVAGTSLQVQPFASLINYVRYSTPRLLINREKVACYGTGGGFDFDGISSPIQRDVFYGGSCDDGVLELAELLGWKEELQKLHKEGHEKLKEQFPEELAKEKVDVDVDSLAAELAQKANISEKEKSSSNEVNKDDAKVDISKEEKSNKVNENKDDAKDETKDDAKDETKDDAKDETKDDAKFETKDDAKDKTKDDAKFDKIEKGETLEDKHKEETKL
ncbi:18374_t:CDS:2 [Racocetra persica]|uniref:18374_t:CDS:1 n=1 Tax=Racocetra persica TaxID=160502 RepID=A0ACA9M313_9GLOM|nr:18374_t:CDS:2 [Racocetra persica]